MDEVENGRILRVHLDNGLGSGPAGWPKTPRQIGGDTLHRYPDDVWILRMVCWKIRGYKNQEYYLLLGSVDLTRGILRRIGIGWHDGYGEYNPLGNTQEWTVFAII